jgi:hypothetical protein
MRVRKVRCPSCGAPKLTATTSAYVYCDFCARFMDWDLQAMKYQGKVAAGPHYRALCAEAEPRLRVARAAKDRAALSALHRTLFDQYMTDCPNGYSPRVRDPAYREAMLARSVHAQVEREIDDACITAEAALRAAIGALEWTLVGQQMQVGARSFWAMYEAVVANDLASKAALERAPQPVPDPDDTPPELSAKMRDSAMAQAWMASLDPETADAFLARTRLADEYEDADEPTLLDATCAHCGAARRAPAGAHQCVCDACGHVTTLGRRAFCGYCGAAIAFPLGAKLTACGHCKAEARLMTE